MKYPKQPKNWNFWLHILQTQELYEQFLKRGNGRQKRELEKAQKYYKWLKIQEKKNAR